ncbi:hypothetical protein [Pseudomonas sp. N2-11]|uniref:hypothetical protein n=1 Tax=Pseudomonas sp. N2-11 TaxID=2962038 RepID=UPI0020B6851F|nr:hypothetical protein [Pseudomonas sp. N2-11]MCP3789464.1 hypothetical protein [Pseudomonas sp. N2-11]
MELKNFFAQDDQGNITPGATCYLYEVGTENLVQQLYRANGTVLTNPFTAANDGLVQLAAANGRYDLRVDKGARSYRIQLQFSDVTEDLTAANLAASRAELARDQAFLEANIYASVAEGLNKTVDKQPFQVLSDNSSEYLVLYLNQAGEAVEQRRYPTSNAIESIHTLIQATEAKQGDTEYFRISDEESARIAYLNDKRLGTPAFDIVSDDSSTQIADSEGGVLLYGDDQRILLGSLEMHQTHLPGIFVVDEFGAVLQELSKADPFEQAKSSLSPFEDGLLFTPVIATCDMFDTAIYPQSILPRRELAADVVATIASTTTAAAASGDRLSVSASKYGAAAVLNLRRKDNAAERRFMNLVLKHVPVQAPAKTTKVLFIGDSIGNRQGGYLLKQYLAAIGINATFIGTLMGTADTYGGSGANGEPGECREGWETGDYTYAVTDRAQVVAAGDEAAYLAMAWDAKRERNPFIRLATASDPAAVVRNGYVFDCAFYQSRFGLQTPDIVIHALGTNDIRDRTAASVYGHIYANDQIIHGQIRKAWPSAKIIRTLPGTAVNAVRNTVWTQFYAPVLRAIQKAAADMADAKTTIAPVWAMTNNEGAYTLPTGTVGADGFLVGDWSDPIHPYGAARLSLYQALAPFVAAAAINLI